MWISRPRSSSSRHRSRVCVCICTCMHVCTRKRVRVHVCLTCVCVPVCQGCCDKQHSYGRHARMHTCMHNNVHACGRVRLGEAHCSISRRSFAASKPTSPIGYGRYSYGLYSYGPYSYGLSRRGRPRGRACSSGMSGSRAAAPE